MVPRARHTPVPRPARGTWETTSAQVNEGPGTRPSRIPRQGLANAPAPPQPDPMPTRPHTPRTPSRLTAYVLTLLALLTLVTLTGCKDGQGVRDEGPAKDRAAVLTPVENQKAARH